MTACVSCGLYLLRDGLKYLIFRETEGHNDVKIFQRIEK